MTTSSAGVRLAIACGLEMQSRWREYWRAIHPWAWIFIALSVCNSLVYPDGNPSRFMSLLWGVLYLSIILLMCWNWQSTLTGRTQQVTWDRGWQGQSFKVYVVTLAALMLGIPVAVSFVVGALLTLVLMATLGVTDDSFIIVAIGCLVCVLYIFARLITLPSLLMANTVAPVPVAWQLTGRQTAFVAGALLAFMLISGLSNLLLVAFFSALQEAQIASPGLWLMPVALSVSLFVIGWLVLLAQRLFEYLSHGASHVA